MESSSHIWMDGEIVKWEEASIHILNHSLHYGSAVFEGIRFYECVDGRVAVFRLDEHIDRLFHSATVMRMKVNYSHEDIKNAIVKLIKKTKLKSGYIRPLIYYGYGKMGLSIIGAPVNVMIAVWPWGSYLGEKAVRVKISEFIRPHPQSTDISAKISGNYHNSILAGEEARTLGYDEALLLDFNGNVAEGPGENIFFVTGGKLITPNKGSILPGITRDSIISIARDNNIEVEEKDISPDEAIEMDEAFFVGTAAEVSSIDSLDGTSLKESNGPMTTMLKNAYLDIAKGNNQRYHSWLTFV